MYLTTTSLNPDPDNCFWPGLTAKPADDHLPPSACSGLVGSTGHPSSTTYTAHPKVRAKHHLWEDATLIYPEAKLVKSARDLTLANSPHRSSGQPKFANCPGTKPHIFHQWRQSLASHKKNVKGPGSSTSNYVVLPRTKVNKQRKTKGKKNKRNSKLQNLSLFDLGLLRFTIISLLSLASWKCVFLSSD